MAALAENKGGRIVTPNVDVLRQAARSPEVRELIDASSLVVADGMPVLWAARMAGQPLPGRVPGSDLIWSLSAAAATHGRSIYLLGGAAGVPEQAATVLQQRHPELKVAGTDSPPFGFDADPARLAATVERVRAAGPDLVFVGLGFPRQERVIARLAEALPNAWHLGCGAAIPFVAGVQHRAPVWMQRSGLEWAHRLANEPTRLFRRYVIEDGPFAARMLAGALIKRQRGQ